MALTKRTFVEQITVVLETGDTFWNEITVIEEDGVELSRTCHRGSVSAGDPADHMPAVVAPLRALVDTPEKRAKVATERAAAMEALKQGMPPGGISNPYRLR